MSAGNNFLGIEKIVKFCYTFKSFTRVNWRIYDKEK